MWSLAHWDEGYISVNLYEPTPSTIHKLKFLDHPWDIRILIRNKITVEK